MTPDAASGLSDARTRTRPRGASAFLLSAGQVVQSPETGARYRVEGLLGQGGFGQVFRARRLVRSRSVPSVVCIKASLHIDGWMRESYFGRLLEGDPRAIRVYDTFPLMDGGRVLYCLVLEYARHGDLRAFLRRTRAGFRESAARREIAGLLTVLGRLHRGQVLHRDLTPMNVFVCDRSGLKLGDFGIVRQQGDRRGVKARTWNPHGAPSDIVKGAVPKWQARDDVYQVGQLLAMLVKGDAESRVRTAEVRRLPCSDHLKEIVYRCIGERRKRYESADELDPGPAHAARAAEGGRAADLVRRPSRLHRGVVAQAARGGEGGEARGGRRPRRPLGEDQRGRARQAQPAPGRGRGRRAEAPGDQAPPREGPPHHAAGRASVLEARGDG